MRSEYYTSRHLIAQAESQFMEFNLALSMLQTDLFVIKGKQEFMLAVGRTTMRENQTKVKTEYLLPSSMFPLVCKDNVLPSN